MFGADGNIDVSTRKILASDYCNPHPNKSNSGYH